MNQPVHPASVDLSARPAIVREPVHPSITEAQISDMVERFYVKIEQEPRMGAIFLARNHGDWSPHLERMKKFWSSVLLHTGQYKGKPVPVHMAISELQVEDFRVWLEMFRETASECFDPQAVPVIIRSAERIARSLWMAKFATPFDQPPEWMQTNTG